MLREISSGGVVVRKGASGWEIAVIEPQRESESSTGTGAGETPSGSESGSQGGKTALKGRQAKKPDQPAKTVYALPKGLVDPGETAQQTALREVLEETGVTGRLLGKLADTKYVYTRKWSDQQRVFKIVSFYLLMYEGGEIDSIAPEMRIEVKRAVWMPIGDAIKKLSYGTEKKVVQQAREQLEEAERSEPW
jgi:8-oxo-dGTP pyrophosphatase MutT (NUDIX family)